MFCNIIANIKQFDIYVFLIIIDSIMYTIEIIVESILYIFLLFLFTIGLLCVSAGENMNIVIVSIIPRIIFIVIVSSIVFIMSGSPMNTIVDDSRHIQLFVACSPNDGILIMLYINRNIINSLNNPSIIASTAIIINLLNIKYSDSSPYLISASFVLS